MRYILIGFGKFGKLTFERLKAISPQGNFIILDPALVHETASIDEKVRMIPTGGVEFLLKNDLLFDTDIIVPVAPFNIAARYVISFYKNACQINLPEGVENFFQNFSFITPSTIVVSNADFLCPDDCPEGDRCTVTGELRMPMYERIGRLNFPGYVVAILKSLQLAPGVGGYSLSDLRSLTHSVRARGKYLIGTSCKCHAIISSIEIASGN
ncbi:MAG: hypothetical protein ACP5U1_01440 [Desulfomonilaceae bacterium]